MSIVSKLAELLAQARSEQSRVEAKLQSLLQRREDLLSLPLPREDFIATIADWIDQTGREFPARLLQHRLSGFLEQPMRGLPARGFNPLTLDNNTVPDPAGLLYLLRDQVQEGVRRALESIDWPAEVGPPRAKRVVELARLDQEIADLQSQLDALKAAAGG